MPMPWSCTAQPQFAAARFGRTRELRFRRRIFHRVGQQIVERVFHQFAVAQQGAFDRVSSVSSICLRSRERHHPLMQESTNSRGGERLALQLHLAVRQPLDVQKSLDDPRQALRFGVDHFAQLLAAWRRAACSGVMISLEPWIAVSGVRISCAAQWIAC